MGRFGSKRKSPGPRQAKTRNHPNQWASEEKKSGTTKELLQTEGWESTWVKGLRVDGAVTIIMGNEPV